MLYYSHNEESRDSGPFPWGRFGYGMGNRRRKIRIPADFTNTVFASQKLSAWKPAASMPPIRAIQGVVRRKIRVHADFAYTVFAPQKLSTFVTGGIHAAPAEPTKQSGGGAKKR